MLKTVAPHFDPYLKDLCGKIVWENTANSLCNYSNSNRNANLDPNGFQPDNVINLNVWSLTPNDFALLQYNRPLYRNVTSYKSTLNTRIVGHVLISE